MKLSINYGSSVSAVPIASLSYDADTIALKLLILLCSEPAMRNIDESTSRLCEALGCDEIQLREAIAFWRGTGIISLEYDGVAPSRSRLRAIPDFKQSSKTNTATTPDQIKEKTKAKPALRDETPSYTGEQISTLLDNEDNGLKCLIMECQNVLGKVLNPTEVGRIASLVDYLGLDAEQILLMFVYYKRKFDNNGKKLSVPYIEKVAYSLYSEGIDTPEKFEKYMRDAEDRNSLIGKLRKLFGFGDRSLSKKEKALFKAWTDEYQMTYEMIEKAYEINIDNKKELSLPYITKILSNWYESGIKDVTAVENAEKKFKELKANSNDNDTDTGSSFNTDDFFTKALQRSYDEMKKAK